MISSEKKLKDAIAEEQELWEKINKGSDSIVRKFVWSICNNVHYGSIFMAWLHTLRNRQLALEELIMGYDFESSENPELDKVIKAIREKL